VNGEVSSELRRKDCRCAPGIGYPADGSRAAGDPLVACDAYGSRFLLVAPFGYDGEAPDHWYA
jgi:hypothetical protein